MNMLGIQLYNMPTSNKSQLNKKVTDKPYTQFGTHKDTVSFSGGFFSKENREKTGELVGRAQNTAEVGAEIGSKTVAVPAAVALAPPVAVLSLADEIFGRSEDAIDADRANGWADWR